MRAVECKDGDVDFLHYATEQRGCFKGAEPLRAQIIAQTVQLEEKQSERIVRIRPPGAQRVIAFAQRSEHVRDSLQRPDDVLAHHGRAGEPDSRDQYREGPLCAGREVAEPEEAERERYGGKAKDGKRSK